jgi:hypothetical protein
MAMQTCGELQKTAGFQTFSFQAPGTCLDVVPEQNATLLAAFRRDGLQQDRMG